MKSIKICIAILIITTLLIPITSIATSSTDLSIDSSENLQPPAIDNSSVGNTTSNTGVISLSSESVSLNTDFYLIVNLSNISFSKFRVEISNTSNLTANTLTQTVTDLESTANITSFTIDKNLINLDKLGIVYTSPTQETNITFKAVITNLDNTKEALQHQVTSSETTLKQEINNLNSSLTDFQNILLESNLTSENYQLVANSISKVTSSLNNALNSSENTLSSDLANFKSTLETIEFNSEEHLAAVNSVLASIENINTKISEINSLIEKINNFVPETLEGSATIVVRKNIVSETPSLDKDNIQNDKTQTKPFGVKNSILEDINKDKEMSNSMKQMMQEMSLLQSDLRAANNTISSLTTSVTYQGSQNNYLKSLSINNVEFKNNFKKTTLNYFADVDENTTSVTVNAVAEDSSAIVTIYGNTNLHEGKNKVLITVTADDGSIRTYKIYISK